MNLQAQVRMIERQLSDISTLGHDVYVFTFPQDRERYEALESGFSERDIVIRVSGSHGS